MTKTLIVYHSRSGNTRRIAQRLAPRLHADRDEIRIVQPMAGALGYALCAIEAITGLTPALRPSHRDPADYDLVVVGTPVWFWSLSSPVRSWLESHPRLPGRIAFFCTMGGSGAARVFGMMTGLSHRPHATLALTDSQIARGQLEELDEFVRRLQAPARAAAHRSTAGARRHRIGHAGADA